MSERATPPNPADDPPTASAPPAPLSRVSVPASLFADPSAVLTVLEPDIPPAAGFVPPAIPGYEILGVLGHGGMGVVLKARHLALNRLVALKMIRGVASPEELARFRTEAEAVARLQHPHVVQIFDVGEHAGQPYLALEYVDGGNLNRRVAGKPQPPRAAAELVQTLARAIHAAHQRHIVHRDLKPANVLLTRDGTPKITDFGLARQTDRADRLTRTDAIAGTPAYMAPEQADGLAACGPAADIYSLGVLLYQLLIGRVPLEGPTPLETLRLVCDQEPVPPRRLQPAVPRDLETVCLKCLEKEPTRRYASAAEFADDLGRFLRGEAVRARPVGPGERAWKWARRRPAAAALVAVSTLLVLSLALGGWAYSTQLRQALTRAETQEAEASKQRLRAEGHYRQALEAVQRLLSRAGNENLKHVPGMEEVRRELLEDALAFYQRFLQDRGNTDPQVRLETAAAFRAVAMIQAVLGRSDLAEDHYREGLALLEDLGAEHPDPVAVRVEQATILQNLALLDLGRGQTAQAEKGLREAAGLLRPLAEGDPDVRDRLTRCLNALGLCHDRQGYLDQAEQCLREGLDLRRQLLAEMPVTSEGRHLLAQACGNLAQVLLRRGQRPEADRLTREAVETLEVLAHENPRDLTWQLDLAAAANNRGVFLQGQGKPREAEEFFTKALEIRERVARAHPLVPAWQNDLAASHHNLAQAYQRAGKLDRAETHYRQAVDVRVRLVAEFPDLVACRAHLGMSYADLGRVYLLTRRPDLARTTFRKGRDLLAPLARQHPRVADYGYPLALCCRHLARLAADDKKWAEAVALSTQAIEALEPLFHETPTNADVRIELRGAYGLRSVVHKQLGRMKEALDDFQRSWNLGQVPAEQKK